MRDLQKQLDDARFQLFQLDQIPRHKIVGISPPPSGETDRMFVLIENNGPIQITPNTRVIFVEERS